jgi:hypothetical protein
MSEYEQYGIQSNIINMSTFKTLKATLENLDLSALQARLKTVEADIENLEDELAKRYDLLKYIDSLILKKQGAFIGR